MGMMILDKDGKPIENKSKTPFGEWGITAEDEVLWRAADAKIRCKGE